MNTELDDAREKIAEHLYAQTNSGYSPAFHKGFSSCMQLEFGGRADQILALSGTTDIECPECKGKGIPRMWHGHHVETKHCPKCDNGVIKHKWKVSVTLENGELPKYHGGFINALWDAMDMSKDEPRCRTEVKAILRKAGYRQVVE